MITVLTVDGVDYAVDDRIVANLRITELKRDLMGGYDELSFCIHNGSPVATWARGAPVSATIDFEDGGGPLAKFQGEITDISWQPGEQGWTIGYTCQGLKYQCDRVPITAPDLTGDYVLNRRPDDRLGVTADRGLTVGEIFTRVLTQIPIAQGLVAYGVVITGLPSAPVLDPLTVADFALLTIVPPQPVSLGGESVFNTLDQILSRWMPKYVIELQPDGIIRCKDTTDMAVFVPRTLTLPGTAGPGDPGVAWPSVRSSTARCATQLVLRGGPIIAAVLLSTADGTLARTWTNTDETNWTLYAFTAPQGAKDEGAITSMTGNTATINPTDNTRTWASNFWSTNEGKIFLVDTTVSGISGFEYRSVTTNTSLSAAGTSVITWDASQPAAGSAYNKYRLVGGAGGLNDVSRLYTVREPHTGATGLSTYIGAHLVVANLSPRPIKWANNSKSIDVFAPTAVVVGGTVVTEVPVGVEALPGSGQFRLFQPAVMAHGNPSDLNAGYPADVAHGLPTDVQILALYSRGALSVTVPASGFEGTAYSVDGLEVVRFMDVPAYADEWDTTAMTELAQQHLDSIKDIVWEGSGEYLVEPDWDVLDFNYALNYAVDGGTCPWTSINAPVRAVTITWGNGSGARHHVHFEFSTRRRAFSGDDLYLHPAFTHGTAWQGNSDIGAFGGMSVTGGFDMPVGQDQSTDFSIGEWKSQRRERESIGGVGGRSISAETPTEAKAREAWQADKQQATAAVPQPRNEMTREQAEGQDATRRAAIDRDAGRGPQPREAQMSRDEAMRQDQERRAEIDRKWDERHKDTQNAGGGG